MILITSANLRWSKRYSKARSASGGIVYGGEADGSTSDVLQRSASGGVVYGGSASGVIESVFRSASGGIVYGGTATAQLAVVWREASGGIVYGGTAALSEVTVIRSASGGITYGGEAELIEDITIVDPTDLANLVNWLDATDANTLYADTGKTTLAAIDGTVAAWGDKSTFGHDFTGAGTLPTRKSGHLLFSGGAYLDSDWKTSFASVNAITLFAVMKDRVNNASPSFLIDNPSFLDLRLRFTTGALFGDAARLSQSVASVIHVIGDPVSKNVFWIKADYTGSNTVLMQANNEPKAESSAMDGSGPNTLAGIFRLSSSSPFTPTTFDYIEMIAYNRALSTAEIEAVKTYLINKHSI